MPDSTKLLHNAVCLAVGCGAPNGQLNNGLAAAREFARNGAAVFIVDRDPDALTQAVQAIKNDTADAHVEGVQADVTNEAEVVAATNECIHTLGVPTILYYNVGVVVGGGVQELTRDSFSKALDINLTGAFSFIKHTIDPMIRLGGGRIITVASVGGMRYVGYDYPAYAASKAGLIALTRNVGLANAQKGIRANCIAPGYLNTPLVTQASFDDSHVMTSAELVAHREVQLQARHAASPTGRMGEPQDVANAAVFLASPASSYINGIVLPIDGGLIQSTGKI